MDQGNIGAIVYPRLTCSDTLITDHDIRLFIVDRKGDVSGSAIEVVNCREKVQLHLDQPIEQDLPAFQTAPALKHALTISASPLSAAKCRQFQPIESS